MPAKMPMGTASTGITPVVTNVYGMQIPQQRAVYRYQVTIKGVLRQNGQGDRPPREIEFTGKTRGE